MIGKSSQDGLRHPVLLNVSFATSLVARVSNTCFFNCFLQHHSKIRSACAGDDFAKEVHGGLHVEGSKRKEGMQCRPILRLKSFNFT
mmetsp:Transcript_17822/g.35227  ORF Transcript_17822/g.35227 Transcript_17822/m.35227 type:complete len:87 (+) Transcript_17822:110-370(+)